MPHNVSIQHKILHIFVVCDMRENGTCDACSMPLSCTGTCSLFWIELGRMFNGQKSIKFQRFMSFQI